MKIYVDDDLASYELVALLRKAGHDVVVPSEIGTSGWSDPRHFVRAVAESAALLTRNYDDFKELHDLIRACAGRRQGILAVRMKNDKRRDMTPRAITLAIQKLVESGMAINAELIVLNQWRR